MKKKNSKLSGNEKRYLLGTALLIVYFAAISFFYLFSKLNSTEDCLQAFAAVIVSVLLSPILLVSFTVISYKSLSVRKNYAKFLLAFGIAFAISIGAVILQYNIIKVITENLPKLPVCSI